MTLFLDTDMGSDVDDALALALILGSPELHLVGVSTVYGNTRLRAQLTRRYLRIAAVEDVPSIAAGTESTRSGRAVWWAGHEGALFPDLEHETVDDDGVGALVAAAAANPGSLDVLAIGPLTNIAAALDEDPEFERNVRRLVVMGGDFRVGAAAEHNILSDVDAARRVFVSRMRIVAGGLDLTTKVSLDRHDVQQIADAGPFGQVIADEIGVWWKFNGEDRNTPHDPILALWLARPELFTERSASVRVQEDGVTNPDFETTGNVVVLDTADPESVRSEIVRRIVCAGSANARQESGVQR